MPNIHCNGRTHAPIKSQLGLGFKVASAFARARPELSHYNAVEQIHFSGI
jgi:hypothetical protein